MNKKISLMYLFLFVLLSYIYFFPHNKEILKKEGGIKIHKSGNLNLQLKKETDISNIGSHYKNKTTSIRKKEYINITEEKEDLDYSKFNSDTSISYEEIISIAKENSSYLFPEFIANEEIDSITTFTSECSNSTLNIIVLEDKNNNISLSHVREFYNSDSEKYEYFKDDYYKDISDGFSYGIESVNINTSNFLFEGDIMNTFFKEENSSPTKIDKIIICDKGLSFKGIPIYKVSFIEKTYYIDPFENIKLLKEKPFIIEGNVDYLLSDGEEKSPRDIDNFDDLYDLTFSDDVYIASESLSILYQDYPDEPITDTIAIDLLNKFNESEYITDIVCSNSPEIFKGCS